MDTGVGSGAALYKNTKPIMERGAKLCDEAMVFLAEIAAIRMGVDMIIENWPTLQPNYLKIFVDSQAAILALEVRTFTSKLVEKAFEALNMLGRMGTRVNICWVKSHIGTVGNERADFLDKNATVERSLPILHVRPLVSLKNCVSTSVNEMWQCEWTRYAAARQTKLFLPEPDSKISKEILALSRRDVTRLVSLLTGHEPLNYHQSLVQEDVVDECRFCLQPGETFFHLVTTCPLFTFSRPDCFGWYQADDTRGWSVHGVLKFVQRTPVGQIFTYLERGEYLSVSIQSYSASLSEALENSVVD